MPLQFAFSKDRNATLNEKQRRSVLVLTDIDKATQGEVGDATLHDDGRVRIEFEGFHICLEPDGSFHGYRKGA